MSKLFIGAGYTRNSGYFLINKYPIKSMEYRLLESSSKSEFWVDVIGNPHAQQASYGSVYKLFCRT